jgi:hypothetical protein
VLETANRGDACAKMPIDQVVKMSPSRENC